MQPHILCTALLTLPGPQADAASPAPRPNIILVPADNRG